jgi:hypothetical protein
MRGKRGQRFVEIGLCSGGHAIAVLAEEDLVQIKLKDLFLVQRLFNARGENDFLDLALGVAITAPNLRVSLLFPPIELSMRQLAIALLAISAGSIILKLGGNEGGEAGHLGGAIIGAILMRWPQLLSGRHASGTPRRNNPAERKIQPRTTIDLQRDSEVDLILDKISLQGFQSLTDREREVLRDVAKQRSTDS